MTSPSLQEIVNNTKLPASVGVLFYEDNDFRSGVIESVEEDGFLFSQNDEPYYIAYSEVRDIVVGLCQLSLFEHSSDWWKDYFADLKEQDRTMPSCSWKHR